MTKSRFLGCALLLLQLAAAVLGKESIEVVYAGFGRSGTKSLSQALKRLGYKTCHGTEMMSMKDTQGIFEALAEQRIDDALRLTEEADCNATLEVHSWWWRAIRKLRPNAKFLVVIRDYDPWERSCQQALQVMQPMLRYPLRWLPMMDLSTRVMIAAAEESMGKGPDDALEYLTNPTSEKSIKDRKQMYDQFVQDGMDFVKEEPDRAILFHLKDGYAPLCEFLGINESECPDEPFPQLNTVWELRITIVIFMILEVSVFAVPVIIILFVAQKLWWRSAAGANSASTKKKKSY